LLKEDHRRERLHNHVSAPAQEKDTPEQCQDARSIGKEMSDGRARLQPCRSISLQRHSLQPRNCFCMQCDKPMWGRAPSPVQAERKLGNVGRSSVAYVETAATIGRLKAVPFQIRSYMSRLFPPFEKREGCGTLGCGAAVEFKGVGQECPTHTSVSDPHRNVRPTQERPISRHVRFLFVRGGWAGSSWFSKIVPGFAVDFVARHAPLAGREDFHAGDVAE
jgi:hypothetical protein